MKAEIIFLTEEAKIMNIILDVEFVKEDSLSKVLLYKVTTKNKLDSNTIKEVEFYKNISFFSSGTLLINDVMYAGALYLSLETKTLSIKPTIMDEYRTPEQSSYTLDIRL